MPSNASIIYLLLAVVFKTHYQELLLRNDEIARLKAVIEGMQTG